MQEKKLVSVSEGIRPQFSDFQGRNICNGVIFSKTHPGTRKTIMSRLCSEIFGTPLDLFDIFRYSRSPVTWAGAI